MKKSVLSRVLGVLVLLSMLLPAGATQPALAEPAATTDDEIIYIDSSNKIKVIDPNFADGNQQIQWESPDNIWFDLATGDFNNDGDKEIVAIGGGKLTVFDPVVRDGSISPDGDFNLVPWKRLHERALNNADIIAAGNLDSGAPGDEIVVGYNVSEPNGINYRIDVLKTADGGRNWTVHLSRGFGAKWTYIAVGNLNNSGSDDLLLGRNTSGDSRVEAHEVDNGFALIFERVDSTLFTQRDGAIGQVYGGGTGEAVLLRSFGGTSEAAVLLIYQFINGGWTIVEDTNNPQTDDSAHFFPHPFDVAVGDVNGSGDDEIIWLREAPSGNTTTARLVVMNRGSDSQPTFETPLDSDNGYRVLAVGDPDGDGRKEIGVMRDNRIRVFSSVESGNTGLFDDTGNIGTNRRTLKMANLDGEGYKAGARFSASPTSLSETLQAGIVKSGTQLIQLTNVGSGGNLPISVSKESGAEWFSFSVADPASTPASIFITQFDASKLAPGVYTDRLKVTSTNTNVLNQPFYIPIQLTVTEASFSINPTSFGLVSPKTQPMTTTTGVTVNGLPGLTFTAAVMSKPEFGAATAALGMEPTRARYSESGALVLGNGSREFTTSLSRDLQGGDQNSRAAATSNWPSGIAGITASSGSTTVQETITVAMSPTLMTTDVAHGVLLVLADERAGAFPDNLKTASFVAIRSEPPVYAPVVRR